MILLNLFNFLNSHPLKNKELQIHLSRYSFPLILSLFKLLIKLFITLSFLFVTKGSL